MYSPKYVDYVDKKRIESTFYNPKSNNFASKRKRRYLIGSPVR